MKEKALELLNKNLAIFNKTNTYNFELYRELKLIEATNPEIISDLGWVECFYNCVFVPKDKAHEVYINYNHFIGKKIAPTYASKTINERDLGIYFDELNNCNFFTRQEPPVNVWLNINEDKQQTTCASSVNNGKVQLFASRVSRGKDLWSSFNTFFKEHAAAHRKRFIVPKGECFGVEIEMLFATVFGKLRFSSFVGNSYPQWSCERDGSLEDRGDAGDCGLELVSPPLPTEQLMKELEIITEAAIKHGGMGHQAGIWYGMHINVNIYDRNKLDTAAKFICLINHPKLRLFWQNVSRRKGASVEEFCQFQNVKQDTCLMTESRDHYRAAFYRDGANCVEVRIFRSNLKHLTLKVSVEILKVALDFCIKNDNINDLNAFKAYITQNASSDLINYLDKIGSMKALENVCAKTTNSKAEYFA